MKVIFLVFNPSYSSKGELENIPLLNVELFLPSLLLETLCNLCVSSLEAVNIRKYDTHWHCIYNLAGIHTAPFKDFMLLCTQLTCTMVGFEMFVSTYGVSLVFMYKAQENEFLWFYPADRKKQKRWKCVTLTHVMKY